MRRTVDVRMLRGLRVRVGREREPATAPALTAAPTRNARRASSCLLMLVSSLFDSLSRRFCSTGLAMGACALPARRARWTREAVVCAPRMCDQSRSAAFRGRLNAQMTRPANATTAAIIRKNCVFSMLL